MVLKRLLLIVALLLIISSANAARVTDSITTDGAYWTAPDGVTIADITVIGAGGSGTGGVYAYQVGSATTYYLRMVGIGGYNGTKATYDNVRVTPGQSYLVRIGMPGASSPGWMLPFSGVGSVSNPLESTASQFAGGPSYVTIDGTTYFANGGHCGNYTIDYSAGSFPIVMSTNTGSSAGLNGYIVDAQIAQSGFSGSYGPGASGGIGYGAGGGGGGMGGDTTATNGGAGAGGVGGQGIIQFTYESGAASEWFPTGYVRNATGTPIQSATVVITQLLNTNTLTTDSSGYYSTLSSNYLANIPVNITISKSGYETDYNSFIPIDSGTAVNTTLLDSSRSCTPPCIDGITKTAWEHSAISGSSVYIIENVSRTGYQTNTSTISGYYRFSNLVDAMVYDVWSSKTGYSNSSVYQVTAVGV